MRAVLASAAVVAALVFAHTAFGASQKDREDCARTSDLDRSIAVCTRLIEDRSEALRDRAAYYNNRGNAWCAKGDYDRAVADYDEAIRLDPKFVDAYVERGGAWLRKSDLQRAIADYDEAIRLRPKSALAHNNRGEAWLLKGDLDRAIADLNEAIRLDPKFVNAYVGRGEAWRLKGDFDRAIADLNEAIRLDPNNAARRSGRAFVYFDKGDFPAAAADLLPLIGSKDGAYLMLFRYLARARAGESATAELEANAAQLKGNEWPLAAIELHLGRRSPEATLDAAGDANARCEAQFYIGEWHVLRGDQANAKSALQVAVDTCPEDFVEHSAAVAELKRLTP